MARRLCLLTIVTALCLWTSAAARAGDVPFTRGKLEALLRHDPRTGQPVDSIDALLPLLPLTLRSNFTLVYDSRSPFRAGITSAKPRVILFSDDARLVLTFIGNAEKPGADLLEAMSFDDATARFETSAYVLPAARRRGFTPSREASDCARCHGSDPRPIYDSYPLWPGFYGSVLDSFPHDQLGAAELKTYAAFLATTAKTGVYRHLAFPGGSATTPYLDPARFRDDTVELDPNAFAYLPNARLGMALTELNRKRIYRKLSAGPRFRANEKVILSELLDCRAADAPGVAAQRRIWELLLKENAARLKRLGTSLAARKPDLHDMQELAFVRELAAMDRAAILAGADRSDWSMAMEKGSLAFFDGILSGIWGGRSYYMKEDLIYEVLLHLAEREPSFRGYFRAAAVFARLGYPFGARIDIDLARKSCPLLHAPAQRVAR